MPSRVIASAIVLFAGTFTELRATREITTLESARPPRVAEPARLGPWGRLESERFILTPSGAALRGIAIDTSPPRWVLPGMTRRSLARLLSRASVPDSTARLWTNPSRCTEFSEGLGIAPSCAMVRSLGPKGLAAVYAALEKDSANAVDRWVLPERHVVSLRDFGLPVSIPEGVRKISVPMGDALVSYCLPCAFDSGMSRAHQEVFLGAMSQQTSREVSLRVTSGDDPKALADYWGTGRDLGARKKLEALFAEAGRIPGGGTLPLARLLPPIPSALLHAFPARRDTESVGTRNCSWTALNFFRTRPDARLSDASRAIEVLTRSYDQVPAPRFGDVAVFLTPDDLLVHAATYLADDLYFTKNGSNALHPWVVNTKAELLASFAVANPGGRALVLRYYRAKNPG